METIAFAFGQKGGAIGRPDNGKALLRAYEDETDKKLGGAENARPSRGMGTERGDCGLPGECHAMANNPFGRGKSERAGEQNACPRVRLS